MKAVVFAGKGGPEVVEVRERINDLLKRTASGRLPLF